MKIKNVTDIEFKKYGKIVQGIDFSEIIEILNTKTPSPEMVVYEPSVEILEQTSAFDELLNRFGGELDIQIGFCNGKNHTLNALEYHRSSEINIAAEDAIILLGAQQDITEEYTYDTSLVEAFLVPKGIAVELYATTLHYAPCSVDDKCFKMGIVLAKGTNYPLENKHSSYEECLLTAKNKWLIGHPEAELPKGTYLGLIGKNLTV